MFAADLAAGRQVRWRRTGALTATAEVDLGRMASVGLVRLEEDIARGQDVARYAVLGEVDGAWRRLSRGTTIGYRKLDRFEPLTIRRVRVVIEDVVAPPPALRVGVYAGL